MQMGLGRYTNGRTTGINIGNAEPPGQPERKRERERESGRKGGGIKRASCRLVGIPDADAGAPITAIAM